MHAILYRFTISPGKDEAFVDAWKALTRRISNESGGLGSRLHREDENQYLAYAQWPAKAVWETAQQQPTLSDDPLRIAMRATCTQVEVLHHMDVVADLLVDVSST